MLSHVDGMGCQLCTSRCPLVTAIEQDRLLEDDVYLRHKEGHRLPVSVRVAPIKDDDGQIVGAVEVFSDSTRARATERRVGELESMALQDSLTSLPNRRYMSLRVQQALQEAEEFGRRFALLFLDVDNFKEINDKWTHSTGDTVLRIVAATLSHNLRSPDIAGRWGGDEFLAIVSDITFDDLVELCERCRNLIAQSAVAAGDERISVSVSIGATMLRLGETADDAINRADQLMYQSKATRNQSTVA
jgi:diguanylate cyclase (GGDEF)-like protein